MTIRLRPITALPTFEAATHHQPQKGSGGMVGRKHYSAAPEAYNSRRAPRGASRIEGAGPHTTYAARLSNRIPAAMAIAESTR